MERKIYSKLKIWKESDGRQPLVLHGARQVGKTHSALIFGRRYYKNTVYFNFEGDNELCNIFEKDLKPERIIKELSVKSRETILKNDTLIIFDEVQACEKALTSLKYFCENDPDYHIIAAGSLLGVALNREKYSFPVGKVQMMTLYPMDFEEFLIALGRESLLEKIVESYDNDSEMLFHDMAMELYKIYTVVGGMPKAVEEYLDKDDFNFVLSIQRNINDAYIADMAKYASPHETTKILAAFNSVPAQLAKENRKFQYKVIKSGARAYDYELPIEWLKSSGVIIKCSKINDGRIPLSAYVENPAFKIFMSDIGLLTSKMGIPPNMIISGANSLDGIKGALAENYVGAAITFAGMIPYYWESKGQAEVDFVFQDRDGNIVPVEVKSSQNVRSKSLKEYIKRYSPKYSIRVSAKNFGFENGIKSVPLYAVFCINRKQSA